MSLKENVTRTLRNFSRVPSWSSIMTKEEIDYLLSEFSDTVFCNGMLRQIKIDIISTNSFKVYTIEIK